MCTTGSVAKFPTWFQIRRSTFQSQFQPPISLPCRDNMSQFILDGMHSTIELPMLELIQMCIIYRRDNHHTTLDALDWKTFIF